MYWLIVVRLEKLYVSGVPNDNGKIRFVKTNFQEMLKKSVPETSVVVRSGGDEFVILDSFEVDSDRPKAIADEFERNMKEYNENSSSPYQIKASYGWSSKRAEDMKDSP